MKNMRKLYNIEYLQAYSSLIFTYRDVFSNMCDIENRVPADVFENSCNLLIHRFNEDVKCVKNNVRYNIKASIFNEKEYLKSEKRIQKLCERKQRKEKRAELKQNKVSFFSRIKNIFKRKKD